MNTMDMTSSPVLTKSILEPYNPVIQDPTQSPLIDLHPFMIAQAFFVAETYRLLPEIYELLWQTLYKLQSQEQMARQSRPAATHGRRRGAPSPDPEPAAPPIIILSQSGPARVPRFQVPAADGGADQGPYPQPQKPTSSPSQQRPARYHLRSYSRSNNNSRAGGIATSNPPNKPPPEPHPAPPVIILSTNINTATTSPPPARPASTPTSTPAFPAPAPASSNPITNSPPTSPPSTSPPPPASQQPHTMGSKVSKLKEKNADGKLQPSQARQDKEEMKEPSNYYTTRSKSMRKKAKAGAPGAAPGLP
ncbi:hypothetical protein L13192_04743 [Pyrenophora tritici-repentis]|uniref:Uncharacterized protein n=1 Tax=Pyrenophora tritici-repentis (strain Pt-1C-BFP) TaxID=426418 RepID=B2WL79_PYRTR|nr:uncharacterized protein PTRG_10739 [Pyrenophora tritici-repentis Pt-1C-BFP]EDU43789.1 predicted protein [Pyrenophora tritici-repentis Pt-1C-BFP]KAI1582011.1 hypothetical protein PtrEW13061_009387 [Pyrenophora tritici-repentis]KAI1671386.1 hypothetical protein L13192_04743 [Pyrenophora tritici-repentis]PWO21246.1 MYB and HSA domain containing protein [Pyrenophora tritici-repentis]